jgi:L-iditol 2-dehydrogenase
MKALMKTEPGVGKMEIRRIAEPEPGPGQVVLEVSATGICGTDIHMYLDEYRCVPPVVLGHEVAGTIAAIGLGVTSVKVGDRVTTETYFFTCGECRFCTTGRPNLCPARKSIGTHVNGGFTRFVLIPAQRVHRLPDNVDFTAGALSEPLACCVHGILELGAVMAGDVAIISGPGAIGLLCMQVARAAGATTVVVGIDGDEARLALARELGAAHIVNAQRDNLKDLIGDLTGGYGADVCIESSGAPPSLRQCLELVRKGGTLAQIGLYGRPFEVDFNLIPMKELRVLGSFAHVPSAWERGLRLMADGMVRTRPMVTRVAPITEWEDAFKSFSARGECKILLTPAD